MEFRTTVIEDARDLFEWRLDKLTQTFSFNSSEFSFSDHLQWLKRKMASQNNLLLTVYVEGLRAGFIGFEVDPKTQIARISININPKYRGKGLSGDMLTKSLQIFRSENTEKVIAEIMIENRASARAFHSAGFEKMSVSDEIVVFGHD